MHTFRHRGYWITEYLKTGAAVWHDLHGAEHPAASVEAAKRAIDRRQAAQRDRRPMLRLVSRSA